MIVVPGFLLVLHGASSVPQKLVDTVNRYGGVMPGATGIPDNQLRKASQMGVCKINVASDTRIAITAALREHFAAHPADFDPRQYLSPARSAVKEMVRYKLKHVFGSSGKA